MPAGNPRLRGRAQRGRAAETAAAAFLARRGFVVLERNVVAGGVELDLVAIDGDWIVFVEVRSRATARFGDPALSVDWHKQRRLARGAHAWLRRNRASRRCARFDVIGVVWEGGRPRISHYRDAFSSPF